jgi:hypothetical protein
MQTVLKDLRGFKLVSGLLEEQHNQSRTPSSGMLHHVALVRTDISEECIRTIFRKKEQAK